MAAGPADQAGRGAGYGYLPALDGVRALAVSAVVLFHAGVPGLTGGFLGVDAFFVLSGFLITSLLLVEHRRTGRIALGAFWGRRARRLLPALLVVLIAVVLAGRDRLPAVEVRLLRGDALAALGYVANWRMIYRGSDYFAQTAAPSPLQHTWSLGIEEQFYLVWPLLVVGLLAGYAGRHRGRRPRAGTLMLLLVCLAGATASALAAAALYRPDNVNRAYFGADSRAQALLIGAALAAAAVLWPAALAPGTAAQPARDTAAQPARDTAAQPARGGRHPVLGTLAVAGAAGTLWAWTHAEGTTGWLYHGGLAACALAVAAVLAHAVASPGSPTARLLALPPLVWLGRISYGVYLWHWPLFRFVDAQRTGLTGPSLLAVRLLLVLVLPVASFFLIEEPIRHGRWLLRLPRAVPVGAAAAAVAGTAVLVVLGTAPVVARTAAFPAPPAAALGAGGSAPAGGTHARRSPPPTPPVRRAGRHPGGQPRVDIFGDSVAWTLGAYLPDHPGLAVQNIAIQGCGITLQSNVMQLGSPHTLYDYCPGWPAKYQGAANNDDPDVAVLLLNRWELMDARRNGAASYTHVGEPDFDAYLLGQLDQAVKIMSSHGAAVVLLTAAYTHRAERPDGGLYDEDLPARVDAWNTLLRKEAGKAPATVTVLDLNKVVCPDGRYTEEVGGLPVRSDGLHFTPEGVQRLIAPWLLPQLTALADTGVP
jgi:peptidoglycan/LPS O-acetylase OafA/YrhL